MLAFASEMKKQQFNLKLSLRKKDVFLQRVNEAEIHCPCFLRQGIYIVKQQL